MTTLLSLHFHEISICVLKRSAFVTGVIRWFGYLHWCLVGFPCLVSHHCYQVIAVSRRNWRPTPLATGCWNSLSQASWQVSAEVESVHTVSCKLVLLSQDQDVEDKRIKCEIYKVGASSPKRIIHFSASLTDFLVISKISRAENLSKHGSV